MVQQGHSGPVTSLAVQHLPDDRLLLASTAADDTVRIWESAAMNKGDAEGLLTQDSWSLVQSIETGAVLQHSLAITQLPSEPDG